MCANYKPVSTPERWHLIAGETEFPDVAWTPEAWPQSPAPFIRQARDALEHRLEGCMGLFGLLPYWAKDLKLGRQTYNARSETVAEKPSFRDAWQRGQRAVIPAESIFEPRWTDGKAVRWRIGRADGRPLAIAGLWSSWKGPDARRLLSFTMLTVNADGHPVMREFHKPGDEKRSIVILPDDQIDAWLDAPADRMVQFMRLPEQELAAEPDPLPSRSRPTG